MEDAGKEVVLLRIRRLSPLPKAWVAAASTLSPRRRLRRRLTLCWVRFSLTLIPLPFYLIQEHLILLFLNLLLRLVTFCLLLCWSRYSFALPVRS